MSSTFLNDLHAAVAAVAASSSDSPRASSGKRDAGVMGAVMPEVGCCGCPTLPGWGSMAPYGWHVTRQLVYNCAQYLHVATVTEWP
jgi:hypothetical protein